ncbi:MAG: twin transmembrane helix small protein [Pseudomonadota bacterium]
MDAILYPVMILAMFAVVAVLMIGIGGFAKGGQFSGKFSNKMMRLRILLQFVAVCLILLYVFLRSQTTGS